ncbi:D-alanyl-D-alanine carboxypeptidase [Streptomyces mashuensis]|uniref:D-alanyl-D-alanine carboxypeptidase n=1 Tax=Streptomyces mashuensis TaxID=33904 RepID=A0A919B8L1_9ACTN|nr:D-alanyl-D-alanine carboxypeptidase/D-alanyl-D-alanine-endopeptidase [Streptomyces mashuensis]GHF63027.1 D-alanyl-D-alanine carboxypeptidase [Streptomyces mashuensis]
MVPEAGRWLIGWWRDAPAPRRGTVRFVAVSTAAGVALAAGAAAVAGPWDGGQRKAERDHAAAVSLARHAGGGGAGAGRGAVTAPPVLGTLRGGARPPGDLGAALEPLLHDPALGPGPAAAVVDVATGERLYGAEEGIPRTPASTVKLATAAAALAALGPEHRIETKVVTGPDGGVVLVGGGDPTLTARPQEGPGPRPAALRDLADATAQALRGHDGGPARTHVLYDASRYAGPALHVIGPNENIAPVSALMVDEGRLDDSAKGPADRTADPAVDAARAFAALLRERGVQVDGEPAEGRADAAARPLAAVSSPPLATLVERALTNSDNDIAEALARQTALASGQPASFEGAARAVTARLAALGLPMDGVRIADGSGLDRADQVSAEFLARLLARAAEPARPQLRPVLTGLPVAGFTGTLRDRYRRDAAGRAVVRAKTGTLTGVNALAGTALSPDGRILAFAFLATATTSPDAAQGALDRLASALTAPR